MRKTKEVAVEEGRAEERERWREVRGESGAGARDGRGRDTEKRTLERLVQMVLHLISDAARCFMYVLC